jgi:hypothetical protein
VVTRQIFENWPIVNTKHAPPPVDVSTIHLTLRGKSRGKIKALSQTEWVRYTVGKKRRSF